MNCCAYPAKNNADRLGKLSIVQTSKEALKPAPLPCLHHAYFFPCDKFHQALSLIKHFGLTEFATQDIVRGHIYATSAMTWPDRPIPPFSVLIVEDDASDCLCIERIICTDVRFRVDATASSYQLAITALQRLSFDLLVVNLQLRDGHSVNIIRHAMEKERARETLALTATHNSSDQHRDLFDAIQAGATGFLLKDEVAKNITEALVRLMSGESPVSAMISPLLLKRFRSATTPSSTSTRLSPILSATERELLGLISRGLTCADAAVALELKPSTVASYVKNIYRKLQVRSRAQATREAVRLGLITL